MAFQGPDRGIPMRRLLRLRIEARKEGSFGTIEGPADFGVVELDQAVGNKAVSKLHVAADGHCNQVRSKPLRPPPPAFDPASGARQRPHNLSAEKLKTAVDKSIAQQ